MWVRHTLRELKLKESLSSDGNKYALAGKEATIRETKYKSTLER